MVEAQPVWAEILKLLYQTGISKSLAMTMPGSCKYHKGTMAYFASLQTQR